MTSFQHPGWVPTVNSGTRVLITGASGQVDHTALGAMLLEIGYDGYVSAEQRLVNDADPLADVAKSTKHMKQCYR